MLQIAEQDIGGARVRLTFTRGGKQMKAGDMLSADEVKAIPLANRRALAEANYIEVFPAAPKGDRFIVQVGKDKFNVIEGRVINAKPLATREHAEALAADTQ